ncbi:MAG: small ribosomal subunit biogenesis GTPase RsgA [Leptolyngbyaceae cyanobacterium]
MTQPLTHSARLGIVLSAQANFYRVQLAVGDDDGLPQASLLCTCRALLKKTGQQGMVGDRVWVENLDWADERAVINAIEPRRTQLDRPPVANGDQVLLVFSLDEPALDAHQLSRFLVKAEATGMAVHLCLNKRDLVSHGHQQAWQERLNQWGYHPILISVQADRTFPTLAPILNRGITIISGPSGVGKSSLINALIPATDLRTNRVSGKLRRGRHTTRHVELFELPQGGLLADTPGFNQPEIVCQPGQLGQYFPEIRSRLETGCCQFGDCLHRDEPGCIVRGDWDRYEHYTTILQECLTQQQALQDSADPEAVYKAKVDSAGKIHHEPKLPTKKYRRVSRRRQQQALQDLRYELTGSTESLMNLEEQDWDTP